jgi:hypothetical protein
MRRIALVICTFLAFSIPAMAQMATFAQLALGGGYEAVLFVTNKTPSSWQGQIIMQQGIGAASDLWQIDCSVNGGDFSQMASYASTWTPYETRKFVFRLNSATTQSGYLRVTASGPSLLTDVALAYFYRYYSGGVLTSSTGSPQSVTGTSLAFAVERDMSVGTDTGYAWAPATMPWNSTFQIHLTLYDSGGNVFAAKDVTFNGHLAQFVSQTFPQLPNSFIGHLAIEAQSAIALEVLRMDQSGNGFLLTSTPASTISSSGLGLSGTWEFTGHSSTYGLTSTGTATIQQIGVSISGQVTLSGTPCASTAALSGTVSGNAVDFQLQEGLQAVSFTGTIAVSGTSMSGTYSAPSGGCTNGDTGTWTATKK